MLQRFLTIGRGLPIICKWTFYPFWNMYNTRSHMALETRSKKSNLGQKSISFIGSSIWNKLSNNLNVLNTTTLFIHKACVCYFLSIFYFFNKWQPFKNYKKCFLFYLKSSLCSQDIQFFIIFPFFSKFSRFKRKNAKDVMNWLA